MFAASKTSTASSGYQISRSLRFNSADSTNVQRTFSTTGTSQTTSTLSMWFKRGDISRNQRIFDCYDGSSGSSTGIFLDNDYITLDYGRGSGAKLVTTQVLRDVSAWYHLVAVFDSSNATSSNRLKLYLNGSQITTFSTAIYPSQNALNNWMSANSNNRVGSSWDGSANFSGYITEVNFIDGQALTPSSFGETNAQTGVWQPKAYSGSYGTNGFYLNFSDNSNTTAATLGKDYSGNGNNWTPNNFSVTAGAGNDSLVDSPTSYGTDTGVGGTVRGNYATLNPLDKGANISASNGNLDVTASTAWQGMRATLGMQSGKWYCEYTPTSGTFHIVSISQPQATTSGYIVNNATAWGYQWDGNKITNDTPSSYGSGWGTGDVIGIAFDADAGTLVFYKNGTSQGTAFSGLTNGPYLVGIGTYPSATGTFNFGQRPFAYTAPSGYKALCTQNLPTPAIGATTATQANKYFDVVLRNGGAPSGGTYSTTVNMANGALMWDKPRNAAFDNYLVDSVRGVSKTLSSNTTAAEATYATWFTGFNNGSFTTGSADWNSSTTVVDWIWAANGSGSTNTAGSITSTVSANTTSGFSVVTYTGTGANATVGHGLGVAPKMVIVRARSMPANWMVWQTTLSGAQYLTLETTNAVGSETTVWNGTTPSSTVISIGTNGATNFSGTTYVAYCFAEVAGYSKFGSYTGNGSADGPFVYTGFRPAYVMFKRTDVANDWVINDATRSAYNQTINVLYANDSAAENTTGAGNSIDILSNGFKLRQTNNGSNASGGTYIFMAFASAPQKFALAR